MTPHIVIVGGGFGGTALARRLERRLPEGVQLTLVSEESTTTFNPLLAEVVGASVFPEQVVAPIRQMLRRSRFVMGRVTQVDVQNRRLRAQTLAGPRDIEYDHLVLAFGTRANLDLVPGLAEHALPLKLVGDALFIRNRVLQRLARIELESDPARRRQLGSFVVIGGGFSGVEVAGALADFLRGALRYYPRVQAQELGVTLLHDGPRLLPELPEALGEAAQRSLMSRGVQVRLGARAAGASAEGVALAGGGSVEGATVVCTIGTRANPLVEQLSLPLQRGRLPVAPDLRVPGIDGLWALGDCALVPNGDGAPCPPTAQFAVAQARVLADNLLATLRGAPTRAFSHRSRGMMATTGHLKGVAELSGLRLSGLPAWLLWRAYYLLLMPTLGRKVRIWVEWTWSMCFSADITHLRFTRTPEADAEAAPSQPALPSRPTV
ncbi:NAD(P)/FAD-dependent oxidoreductase [Azohydromonas australica]|uniref:NAD(P)/FAD-dependent oxidoreductase n=1 Tax=Azohydromonas australica TaxID=364039 RepID=UPI00040DA7E0|nr:NAD(P)/FAD-dependent oxidoreductase [Azohydromonas australica]